MIIYVSMLSSTVAYGQETLIIPQKTSVIQQEAFYGDLSIEDVVLPKQIKSICDLAFAESSLQYINLPESIEYISENAFHNCNEMTAFVYNGSYASLYCENNKIQCIVKDSHLQGKIMVFDGDSIGSGDKDIPRRLSAWYGRLRNNQDILGKNYSVSGGTITAELYNQNGYARHCVSRNIDKIYSDYPNLDYIILEGGTNDADLIGMFVDDIPPSRFGTWSENDYSGIYDDTTFCGAVDSMFYKVNSYWPDAHKGYIIPMKMGSGKYATNRKRYFDEANKIAQKWGISVLNIWDGCPFNSTLIEYYNPNKSASENIELHKFYCDGQHPTSYGYDKMQPIIEAWIKSLSN